MEPGIFNFKNRYAGDTSNDVRFELTEEDGTTPINLTGVTFLMQIKSRNYGVMAKELTGASGITIVDAVGGIFNMNSFVVDFSAGKYVYDIQLTFPSGVVKTYLRGQFNVVQDISRWVNL